MATVLEPMTTEAMLSLPETGVERWLIDGELREKPKCYRVRVSAAAHANISTILLNWTESQTPPRGEVYGGNVGVILHRHPDTTVGIDVVYISPELAKQQTEETTLIEGVPTLVVEILSPNDTVEQIEEKIQVYLNAGVPLIWIVNPYRRTVTIISPDQKPVLVNEDQEICGEPHLPGFRVKVAEFFE